LVSGRHKQSAEEIEKIANMAKTTSTEAYDTLNSVLKQETTLRSTLNDLSQRYECLAHFVQETLFVVHLDTVWLI